MKKPVCSVVNVIVHNVLRNHFMIINLLYQSYMKHPTICMVIMSLTIKIKYLRVCGAPVAVYLKMLYLLLYYIYTDAIFGIRFILVSSYNRETWYEVLFCIKSLQCGKVIKIDTISYMKGKYAIVDSYSYFMILRPCDSIIKFLIA